MSKLPLTLMSPKRLSWSHISASPSIINSSQNKNTVQASVPICFSKSTPWMIGVAIESKAMVSYVSPSNPVTMS